MPVMLGGESAVCDIRGLRCHLRHWGPRNAPLVMLLHGWMDAGASWQFVAERLAADWHCVAVDWRGFGESQWAPDGVYAYPDFLVDLDVLLDQLTPGEPARLVGHSMGGNLCAWYAAARPERVRSLVCVEGFGLRAHPSSHAASHLRGWLADARRSPAWRSYGQLEDVVARVRERSSRVSPERAKFVASHWAERDKSGAYRLRADPGHRRANPDLFREDEAIAIWSAICAPVLWIEAKQTDNLARHGLDWESLAERRQAIPRLERVQIDDCGHMVHWDQPERLAGEIDRYLRQSALP